MGYKNCVFANNHVLLPRTCSAPKIVGDQIDVVPPAVETLLLDHLCEVLKKRNHQAGPFAPEMQQPIERLLAVFWQLKARALSVGLLRHSTVDTFDTPKWEGPADFPPIFGWHEIPSVNDSNLSKKVCPTKRHKNKVAGCISHAKPK